MDVLNGILSFVGIGLGFLSVFLTFITFFAPETIQRFVMRDPRGWRRIPSIETEKELYRHRIFSGFTLEVDFSQSDCDGDFSETWMEALHRPDPRASSHYVTLYFNGYPMERQLFVRYDGTRNFIPVPRIGKDSLYRRVYFDQTQRELADIVGYDYFDRKFSEVEEEIIYSVHSRDLLKPHIFDSAKRLRSLGDRIEKLRTRSSKI